jgi:hypothetical protein
MKTPTADAESYVDEGDLAPDDADATPSTGASSVLGGGWDAAEAALSKKSGDYPTDFKFTEEARLVKFIEDQPFAVYEQFWIEKEGKKSYVSLGDDDPLAVVAGQKARSKFAFNVLVLTDDKPNLQILTAPPSLARQLKAANDDARRGPLSKHYWAIARQGSGAQTTYSLERVKRDDLADEWELDADEVDGHLKDIEPYDATSIYTLSYEEHMKVAQAIVKGV